MGRKPKKLQRRNKGQGTITMPKGRNCFYVIWKLVDGLDANGKPKYKTVKKSLRTPNRREAEARLSGSAPITGDWTDADADTLAKLVEINSGDENQAANVSKAIERNQIALDGARAEFRKAMDARPALTLAQMFATFRYSPRRKGHAGDAMLDRWEQQTGKFTDWIAKHYPESTEMRHISPEIAADFLAKLGAKVSANTYNKYLNLLKAIWRTIGQAPAVGDSPSARCFCNPWDGNEPKPLDDGNGRRALTVEELTRVCSSLDGDMRLLFAVGIYTGLRLGDCALMDWGSVDMVRGVIVLTPRKTARSSKALVNIPLHPVLRAMLNETPANERKGFIMPEIAVVYNRNEPELTKRIQAVFVANGIATTKTVKGYAKPVAVVGFHSLRHTFVSLMGNSGAPLALVQSIVGHSNPMMTAHYFHAATDALVNAVAVLPDIRITEADTKPAQSDDGALTDAEKRAIDALTTEARNLSPRARRALLEALRRV